MTDERERPLERIMWMLSMEFGFTPVVVVRVAPQQTTGAAEATQPGTQTIGAAEEVTQPETQLTESCFYEGDGDVAKEREYNKNVPHPPTLFLIDQQVVERARVDARTLLRLPVHEHPDFKPETTFKNHLTDSLTTSQGDIKRDIIQHKRKIMLKPKAATTTEMKKNGANASTYSGIFELGDLLVKQLRDVGWGEYEPEDAHILDQTSAATRYKWHQDKHNSPTNDAVSVTVVVEQQKGSSRSSFLWRLSPCDVRIDYESVGDAIAFSSLGYHATAPATSETDKVIKITYFFEKKVDRGSKRQRRGK